VCSDKLMGKEIVYYGPFDIQEHILQPSFC